MKIGVIVPAAASDSDRGRPSWPAIASFARSAEAHGLDSVWIEVRAPETAPPAEQDGDDRAFDGSVDELAEALAAYDELGIGHLIVVQQPMTEASLDGWR